MLRNLIFLTISAMASFAWAGPRVLIVSPEQTGLLQTGGLAHATTGLAVALNNAGAATDVLMPLFVEMSGEAPALTGERISVALDWRNGQANKRSDFAVMKLDRPANPTIFLRHQSLSDQANYFDNRGDFGRQGYGPTPTLGESFGAFAKAAADYILTKDYDVVMLNDWTTGLIALHLYEAKLKGRKVPKVIFAIHNIAYQGNFPLALAEFLGLKPEYYSMEGYEFYGHMSMIKAGMIYSDATYTVSRQYAKEIATPRFGAGLDGVVLLLQTQNRVLGFLNGITEIDWDPRYPQEGLDFTFDAAKLDGKALGKAAMQAEFGLPVDAKLPVFILTSRLANQKGFDYLTEAIGRSAADGRSQWIITGDGDQKYVDRLLELERWFPEHVRYRPFSSQLEKKSRVLQISA